MDESLQYLLKSLAPFSDKELEEAEPLFKTIELNKNDFFVKAGHYSEYVGFVVSGLLRSYYTIGCKETTSFFALPGSVTFDAHSFLRRKPSVESIQALENSVLIGISRKDLYSLYENDWKWQQVGRLLFESYFVSSEERTISLQSLSAQELYDEFVKNHPVVVQHVPLVYIASYLGITPETISRIRKK